VSTDPVYVVADQARIDSIFAKNGARWAEQQAAMERTVRVAELLDRLDRDRLESVLADLRVVRAKRRETWIAHYIDYRVEAGAEQSSQYPGALEDALDAAEVTARREAAALADVLHGPAVEGVPPMAHPEEECEFCAEERQADAELAAELDPTGLSAVWHPHGGATVVPLESAGDW
jgi:hypothetical protein